MKTDDRIVAGITQEALAALLDRHNLGPIVTVEALGGTARPMLRVNDEFLVRLSRGDGQRSTLVWEATIYRRLSQIATIPSAPLLALDTRRDLLPYDVLVLRFVHGVSADTVWPTLPATIQEHLSEELGRVCGTIHSLPWNSYGEYAALTEGSTQSSRWADIVFKRIERVCERAAAINAVQAPFLDALITTLNEGNAIYDSAAPPALAHTDLQLSNVLLREVDGHWQIAALIDWEQAIIADPVWEFAALWRERWSTTLYPQPDAFLYGYKERHPLPLDFRVRQRLYRLLHVFERLVDHTQQFGAEAERTQWNRVLIERLLTHR